MARSDSELQELGAAPTAGPIAPAPEPAPLERGRWSAATLAPLAALAVCLAALVAVSVLTTIRTPFSDPHDWDELVFITERTGDWLGYLWRPHTAQRIVFARLLAWLDMDGARGHVPVYLLATLPLLVAEGAALMWALARGLSFSRLGWAVGGVAALLALNVAAAEDCALPVFSVYVLVCGFAAFAILLFDVSAKSSALFAAALLCGVLAGFGNEAGLAVWPVLALSSARDAEATWRQRVLWIVAVAYIALCLIGAGGSPSETFHAASLIHPAHLVKMVLYFAAYCALPWAAGASAASYPARVVGLALAAYAVWLAWRGPQTASGRLRTLERIGVDLALFALVTAVLATVGRVDDNGPPIAASRYFPFSALLQVGLVFASTPLLVRLWSERRGWCSGGLIAFSVFAIAQAPVVAKPRFGTAHRIEAANAAFDRGDRSPEVVALVHPDPELAGEVRAELKQRGLPY